MGLTTYVMILFGISLALYFTGYSPVLLKLFQCPGATELAACQNVGQTNFATTVLQSLFTMLSNPAFLGAIGLAIFLPFVTGGNFSILYIIPILIVFAISNFIILPTDFILDSALPMEIRVIILGFINIWLLLIVVEFIRGGS